MNDVKPPEFARLLQHAAEAYRARRYEAAIDLYRQALVIVPGSTDTRINLGAALRAGGKLDEAVALLEEIAAAVPDNADAHNNLANALRQKGRHDDAITHYIRAIELRPGEGMLRRNLGNAYLGRDMPDKALEHLRRALELGHDVSETWCDMAMALARQDRHESAIACFRRAVALSPDYAMAWFGMGVSQEILGDFPAANAAHTRALALDPRNRRAMHHFAQSLVSLGEVEVARRAVERLIAEADAPEIRLIHARACLLAGDFVPGFQSYEHRWIKATTTKPEMPMPEWKGEDLRGKRIVLWAEQGMGDIIQFVRFAAVLKAHGATVYLLLPHELKPIMDKVAGVDRIIYPPDRGPSADYHCALLSLPLHLGLKLESIPARVPYLSAPGDRALPEAIARARGIKIGVAWAGNPKHDNDRNRSIEPNRFLALAEIPGVSLFSLQIGPPAAKLAQIGADAFITDLAPAIKDWGDTAAILEKLDLVISVDTSIVHLAGALNRPVWALIPRAPDWRWMLERPDSPWYPSLRLFRQPVQGDWATVFRDVTATLRTMVRYRRR